jgi:hypothetical protein
MTYYHQRIKIFVAVDKNNVNNERERSGSIKCEPPTFYQSNFISRTKSCEVRFTVITSRNSKKNDR